MADHLHDCMTDIKETDSAAFQETFCKRCRNPDCCHAMWSRDKFGTRVATQMDRLFKPSQADPRSSRYSMLVDFADMMETALRLEEADRRGDWEIPGSITLPSVGMGTTPQPVPEIQDDLVLPEPDLAALEGTPVEAAQKPVPVVPKTGNTPVQGGGVLLGAAPPTSDPWAGPVAGKSKVVPVGAKVTFGSGTKEK